MMRVSWIAIVSIVFSIAGFVGVEPADARDDVPHVRPISMLDQLDYCETLLRSSEAAPVVEDCFEAAAGILRDGVRLRDATSRQSPDFEAELERGAMDLAARLSDLRRAEPARLERALREIRAEIGELRIRLSRLAAADGTQLTLVSRGGASLGNWQAGFLFSVTEWAKRGRDQRGMAGSSASAFSTVTGASAGAVNGFAATIEGCRDPNYVAAESLYYQIWINLGLFGRNDTPGLFPQEESGSSALALFSGDALETTLDRARKYADRGGMLPSCSVDFGFVATHIDPKVSPVHVRSDGTPILTTRKLKEKFSVRMRFDENSPSGDNRNSLRITNVGPSGGAAGDLIYYAGLGHADDVSLDTLLTGVRASGAFPGAFPPVPLDYIQHVPGPNDTVIPRHRTATFIDGGILDNTPVGLAVAMDSWRHESGHPGPHLDGLLPAEPRTYLFLEPLVRSWNGDEAERADSREAERGLVLTYLGFTGDLLATTVDAQLSETAEQFSFVRRERKDWAEPRLSVPERHMPITGAQFSHFMGFLERDFRIFDFYVGMADAHQYLEREACLAAGDDGECSPDAGLQDLDSALKRANPRYRCIRAYYGDAIADIADRMTADELPEECSFSEDSIANHNFRVLLVGMHNLKAWMQSEQYSQSGEMERFFDEISSDELQERFVYVDLGSHLDQPDGDFDSEDVLYAFRTLIQESIVRIAAAQPGLSKYFIQMGGRAVADIAYGKYYPKRIIGVGIVQSGIEVVYGRRLWTPKLRWDSTFRYFRLGVENYAPELEPFTSEFYLASQATWISSPTGFLDLEIGAGWVAAETVAYNSSSPGHVGFRTGPRSYLGLVALQRIYLALNVDYYPFQSLDSSYRNTGTEILDDWNWNLAVGWRFLY